jgi:hypothetical protein
MPRPTYKELAHFVWKALSFSTIAFVASCCLLQAQQKEAGRRYLIPAHGPLVRGGFVNLSEGAIEFLRPGAVIKPLKAKQVLENGDTITVRDGRAEILLSPGYYLRLSRDSLITFLETSPGNTSFKLSRGSAILEISINSSAGNFYTGKRVLYDLITIVTPQNEFAVISGGVYRFDVTRQATTVHVPKGLVVVAGKKIKDGMSASVTTDDAQLASLDGKTADAFDDWSRQRAANLIQGNKSLKGARWFREVHESPFTPSKVGERQTLSARSGFVRLAEPGSQSRLENAAWLDLKSGENLSNGERIKTSPNCRVDVRAYPDIDLLLMGNSEIAYLEPADGRVSVEVISGSAILISQPEPGAIGSNTISLIMAGRRYVISKPGIFRVNAQPGRAPEFLIFDGEVAVAGHHFKGPRKLISQSEGLTDLEFDKSSTDAFDAWAERRSQLQSIMRSRQLLSPLGGVWFVIEATGQYTFVPAQWSYHSPYGGNYSVKYISFLNMPIVRNQQNDNSTGPVKPEAPRADGLPRTQGPRPAPPPN